MANTRRLNHRDGIRERKRGDGRIVFQARVHLRGFKPQVATFEKLTEARKWVDQTKAAIRERRWFKSNEALKHTVADVIARYRPLIERDPRKKSRLLHLDWWHQALGPLTLADLGAPEIVECRDRLLREPNDAGRNRTPATVNRYLATLSHALTLAAREWGWIEQNPAFRVVKPREPAGRIRFLSDDERKALLAACERSTSPNLYDAVVLALSTGMRFGELMGLRWRDMDLSRGWTPFTRPRTRIAAASRSPAWPWSACRPAPRCVALIPTWCSRARTGQIPPTSARRGTRRSRPRGSRTSSSMTCATAPRATC
jgi:integrase